MNHAELTIALKHHARELGFAASGVCPAVSASGFTRLRAWVDAGYAGEMDYFRQRLDAYEHPRSILPNAASLLILAMPYRTAEPERAGAGQGRVSRYAWGHTDYHDLIRTRLRRLRETARTLAPHVHTRGVVDTAPLLEREFAQLSGIGWIGKNTLLLNRELGSWFFLAALLLDCELAHDKPFEANHCGSCTACLDICPTKAFPKPYVLDASRCISYLTIEHRSSIPAELRPATDAWLFGCDLCQEVCPWNRQAPISEDGVFAPDPAMNPASLGPLFQLDDAAFRKRFRGTAIWRSHRRGLLRNAAIALGNHPLDASLEPLTRGLGDREPLVRAASAWALGRFHSPAATRVLKHRQPLEPDPDVQAAIQQALDCQPRI